MQRMIPRRKISTERGERTLPSDGNWNIWQSAQDNSPDENSREYNNFGTAAAIVSLPFAAKSGANLFSSGVKYFGKTDDVASAGNTLFHYTSAETATLIERSGQIGLPGRAVYLTDVGNLKPLQAQIELALPATNSANAIFQVNTRLFNFSTVRVGRVTGNVFNRGGGGTEFVFDSPIPANAFRRIHSMRLFEINDKRFEVGVELLKEGQSITFNDVDFWLNKQNKQLEVRAINLETTVSEQTAINNIQRAKSVFSYLVENSSIFAKIINSYSPRFSLISDYGMGAVEICHLSEGEIIWT